MLKKPLVTKPNECCKAKLCRHPISTKQACRYFLG